MYATLYVYTVGKDLVSNSAHDTITTRCSFQFCSFESKHNKDNSVEFYSYARFKFR